MCAIAHYRAPSGDYIEIESVGELKRALGVQELIWHRFEQIGNGIKVVESSEPDADDHCLCNVAMEKSAMAAGWVADFETSNDAIFKNWRLTRSEAFDATTDH